jgi:UDP-galactopyranose mutase
MKYDYIIVGSGLFGATFARLATDAGKKCLVLEARNHIGGNVYSEKVDNIDVHTYGPHIFHTNDKTIWDFVHRFSEFNSFVYSPKAKYSEKLYSLPFNMNTFNELWGVITPKEAMEKINEQRIDTVPTNLEEQAISLVGTHVYEMLIKEYTKKQWQRDPKDLPTFIIKRLPVRFTYDNNYFNDKYQGIPSGGYHQMMLNMLDGIEVKTEVNYFDDREYWNSLADKVVFTGKIDEFFDYEFGELEYRTLRFEHEVLDTDNHQGVAVINDTGPFNSWTRTIEHKHFNPYNKSDVTVLTKEYPDTWSKDKVPYYPINDERNTAIFNKYRDKAKTLDKFIFGGRLSEYQYYDMHQVIGSAMARFKKEYK